jgi:hypothetical protein
LLLITRPTLVEKIGENRVGTEPLKIGTVPTRTHARRRARGHAGPPADRTRLPEHHCDRRSQGFRTDVCTQSVLSTRRMLTGRAKPSCSATQRRRRRTRAAPPLDNYWLPRHRLAHAATHCPTTPVTPSTRHERL